MRNRAFVLLLIVFLSGLTFAEAQSKTELEQRRKKLQQELREINAVLSTSTRNERSILFELQSTAQKIKTLEEIISLTNRQMNSITAEINKNLQAIDRLKEETVRLKTAYAQMALNAYKSKNQQSRLMF
ncbi:MAG: hypothetical protein RQ756_03460, partial [Flavobacteriaceae bacterium]|nr:hypothetical protein [Flavobacteriaceae bacterium]